MSSQSTPSPDWITLEQYARLRGDAAYREELSGGRVVREPRPGARHGRVAFKIARLLSEFVQAYALGSVEMETGFLLAADPPAVRGPDVAFISLARLPAETPTGWWPFAPDLAVEVASPSNAASDIEAKVLEYLTAGVRMVWVVDPESHTARIYTGDETRIVRAADELNGGDVIPGFAVRLQEILSQL